MVVLGEEEFHLEVLSDPAAGRLVVHVLDGHLEGYIRLPEPALEVVVRLADGERRLALDAVRRGTNAAAPETTAVFAGEADWLQGLTRFQAEFPLLQIRGREYRHVRFDHPGGNVAPVGTHH